MTFDLFNKAGTTSGFMLAFSYLASCSSIIMLCCEYCRCCVFHVLQPFSTQLYCSKHFQLGSMFTSLFTC